MEKNKGCDTCEYFQKVKWNDKGVGLCEYEDMRLNKIIKSCKNYKSKKYKRNKSIK